MPKPAKGTYPAYYETYISKVKEDHVKDAFSNQADIINNFFDKISEEKSGYAYSPGKWTLKELLQHIIDAERIFAYRALSFARKDETSLPGFDENNYADNSYANERNWQSLVDELKAVRKTTEILFDSFNTDMLNHSGLANNNPVTVNAIGFIVVGHLTHHKNIVVERYL
ncbi:MAG: DinB family protein [Ferruginibacter sp.]